MLRLANEEFNWKKNTLTEVGVMSGSMERVSEEEVRRAVAKMKCSQAHGFSDGSTMGNGRLQCFCADGY